MIAGEGNGKPLLNSNFCLENPLQDHQEPQQTRRTTTATTTTTKVNCIASEFKKVLWTSCKIDAMHTPIQTPDINVTREHLIDGTKSIIIPGIKY
jgi:hypothetical protein